MAVKPAPVVYIALEGRGGISKRIKAWEAHYKALSEAGRFLLANLSLLEPDEVKTLGGEIVASMAWGPSWW